MDRQTGNARVTQTKLALDQGGRVRYGLFMRAGGVDDEVELGWREAGLGQRFFGRFCPHEGIGLRLVHPTPFADTTVAFDPASGQLAKFFNLTAWHDTLW